MCFSTKWKKWQVSSQFNHKHPRFVRLHQRRCPNSLFQVTLEALPKFNMWMQWMASLVQIRPQTSTILQVTLEGLHKFHMSTQIMTRLVPIPPRKSTINQVTPEAQFKFNMWMQLMTSLPRPNSTTNIRFFRLRRRRCPNSTSEHN